jgi:hypothetical protein
VGPPLLVYTPEGGYCPEVSSFFEAGS